MQEKNKKRIIEIGICILPFIALVIPSAYKWIGFFNLCVCCILSVYLCEQTPNSKLYLVCCSITIIQIIIVLLLLNHFNTKSLYATYSIGLDLLIYLTGLLTYYGTYIKQWKVENLFLVISIVFGCFMTLNLPIKAVPDERTHLYTAYAISDRMLTGFNKEKENFTIRQQDEELLQQNIEYGNSIDIMNWYYSQITHKSYGDSLELAVSNGLSSNHIAYYIPAGAIAICRALNCNAFWTLMSGRIINYLQYILLIYFSIKLIPFAKLLPFTIALYPMAVQQGMSYSYDCLVIALSIFVISTSLSYKYGDLSKYKKYIQLFLVALASILLFALKSHSYAFISLVPIVVLLSDKKWFQIIFKIGVGILCIFGIVFVLYAILDKIFQFPDILVEPDNPIVWAGNIQGYTLQYFINEPYDFIIVNLRTLKHDIFYFFFSAISSYLGWLNVGTPKVLAFIFFGLSGLSVFSNTTNEKMNRYIKTYFGITVIFTELAITFALLVGHTFKYAGLALGLQGRYFLPLIMPLLLICQGIKKRLSLQIERAIPSVLVILLMLEAYFLICRF